MVGTARLFVGGLPISKELGKDEVLKVVSAYSKDVEIIRDSEGYCKGFAYINVPSTHAETCIEKLGGAPFQKGLLRVEHAKESFMDRLRREWGDAALNQQYTFPSTNFLIDTNSKPGSATKPKPTPTKLTNGYSTAKPAQVTKLDTPETAPTPPKSLSNKDRKKEQFKEKARKAAKKDEQGEKPAAETPNKRKAEVLETTVPEVITPAEAPPKKEIPPKKDTPKPKTAANGKKKAASLNLGDEDPQENVEEKAEEKKVEEKQSEEKKQQPAKKQKQEPKKNTPKPPPPATPKPPPSTTPPPATPVPTTPTTSYPITPSTTTPAPNNNGVTFWDIAQVQTWAVGVAGDDIAEKLKSKGVKGRKLVNWKDTYATNPNGLRKQITEFLQLPENMEADADDLSVAILKLQ